MGRHVLTRLAVYRAAVTACAAALLALAVPSAALAKFGFSPTDAESPSKGIELGVVAEKPWFSGFISSPLEVQPRGACSYMGRP